MRLKETYSCYYIKYVNCIKLIQNQKSANKPIGFYSLLDISNIKLSTDDFNNIKNTKPAITIKYKKVTKVTVYPPHSTCYFVYPGGTQLRDPPFTINILAIVSCFISTCLLFFTALPSTSVSSSTVIVSKFPTSLKSLCAPPG